ncbi:MAG: hypothetical protein GYB26_06380 [Gammaproteobacteria bacterium]|uniref:Uncharacterized protein n=1 Tax=Marinobacter litoralis TaxID=187981 RepID=A0A3M2RL87_9GAMM|nr:hypothetical protein [Marinobacter litoralis]MBR9870747.1 hypothetical protein [Gammaproteobacteria bacterium]RMJ05675.1 hypothetical protein DOQ08_00345 [Marinobacter litoralis]
MSNTVTRQPRSFETDYPRIRRNRKDVLGLAETSNIECINLLQDCQKLARKGFRVTQQGPEHWIIRGNKPLPEIHCYSESEVHRFTVNNG